MFFCYFNPFKGKLPWNMLKTLTLTTFLKNFTEFETFWILILCVIQLCIFVPFLKGPKLLLQQQLKKLICDVLRAFSGKVINIWLQNSITTLYTKEGKKLYFPDFLVYWQVYLKPNQVKKTIIDFSLLLNTYLWCYNFTVIHGLLYII